MASIELWIQWCNAHGPHYSGLCPKIISLFDRRREYVCPRTLSTITSWVCCTGRVEKREGAHGTLFCLVHSTKFWTIIIKSWLPMCQVALRFLTECPRTTLHRLSRNLNFSTRDLLNNHNLTGHQLNFVITQRYRKVPLAFVKRKFSLDEGKGNLAVTSCKSWWTVRLWLLNYDPANNLPETSLKGFAVVNIKKLLRNSTLLDWPVWSEQETKK